MKYDIELVLNEAYFVKLLKGGMCSLFFSRRMELLEDIMRAAKVKRMFINVVGAVEVLI
jgi:hypothetical protein